MNTRPSDINTVRDESLSGTVRRGLLWLTILASVWVVPLTGVAVGAILEGRTPALFLPGDGIRSLLRILGGALKPTGDPWWSSLPSPAHGPHSPVDLFAGLLVGAAVYAAAATAGWQTLITRTGWRENDRQQRRQMDGAAWAEPNEVSHLLVDEDELGDRVGLGTPRTPKMPGKKIVAVEPGHSALIVAPTGRGKTESGVAPAVMHWDGPVVCFSIKRDVYDLTAGYRATRGETRVLDPAGLTDPLRVRNAFWTPIPESRSWLHARLLADQMCGVGLKGAQASGNEEYFANAAGELLAGLLFAAAHSALPTMATVQGWLTDPKPAAAVLEKALTELRDDPDMPAEVRFNAPHALAAIKQGMVSDDPRAVVYVIKTVNNALRAWNEWRFAHVKSGDPGVLEPEWLWTPPDRTREPGSWETAGEHRTLYGMCPESDQQSYRGMFIGAVTQIYNAYARAQQSGRVPKKRLLIVLDEVANMTPIPVLDRWVTAARGLGINLVLATQNLAQLDTVWGREKAETIASGPRVRMFGPGIADEQTLAYIEKLGGDTAVLTDTVSRTPYFFQIQTNRSTNTQWRPLVTKDVVRQIPPYTGLVFYGTTPPFTVNWRSAHTDPRLEAMQKNTPIPPTQDEVNYLTTPDHERPSLDPNDPTRVPEAPASRTTSDASDAVGDDPAEDAEPDDVGYDDMPSDPFNDEWEPPEDDDAAA